MTRATVTRAASPVNYAVAPNGGKGVMMENPSRFPDASHLFTTVGTASLVTATGPDGETKVVQVEYNATPSYGQLRNTTAAEQLYPGPGGISGPIKSFGVWVKNPSNHSLGFSVTLFNTASAQRNTINMAAGANTDWTFYTAAEPSLTSTDFSGTDKTSIVRYTAVNANAESAWAAGDMLQFGKCYINARSSPKFYLCTDDGNTANVTAQVTYPTGYGNRDDGTGVLDGTYLDICNHYGYSASAFIMTGYVGTAGYMSWDQIATLHAAGWDICNHHTLPYGTDTGYPNLGITYLSYDEILADSLAAKAALDAHGYSATSNIMGFSQGCWSESAISAARAAGMRCLIGIGLYNAPASLSIGRHSSGGMTNGTGLVTITSGGLDIVSRIQIDAAGTDLATFKTYLATYLTTLVSTGGIGGCYTHDITALTASKFDYLCSTLKKYEKMGLLDVVTLSEWLAGTDL